MHNPTGISRNQSQLLMKNVLLVVAIVVVLPPFCAASQNQTGANHLPSVQTAVSNTPASDRAGVDGFTIFMIGDSTMADKPVIPPNPERGWGQMLPGYFKPGVRIENHAVNGRSSKSFLDEGRWQKVREKLKPGDWVIIQFGHNDEKRQDPKRFTEPFGEFKANLERFIRESRAAGAKPVVATAIARRKFDKDGNLEDTHGDYIKAAREVAAEQNVPLLDLNRRSDELLRKLGPELSKKIYLWLEPNEFAEIPNGRQDDTHFSAFGASRICDLAVEEMKTATPELTRWLRTGN